jgi:hypothetical protein
MTDTTGINDEPADDSEDNSSNGEPVDVSEDEPDYDSSKDEEPKDDTKDEPGDNSEDISSVSKSIAKFSLTYLVLTMCAVLF